MCRDAYLPVYGCLILNMPLSSYDFIWQYCSIITLKGICVLYIPRYPEVNNCIFIKNRKDYVLSSIEFIILEKPPMRLPSAIPMFCSKACPFLTKYNYTRWMFIDIFNLFNYFAWDIAYRLCCIRNYTVTME